VSPLSSLGGSVWHDTFHSTSHQVDGLIDSGEPALSGIAVQLYDTSETTLLASTTTDSSGTYQFAALPAGQYAVKIADSNFTAGQALSGWYPTLQATGGSVGSLTTHDAQVSLPAGVNDNTMDFGFFMTGVTISMSGATAGNPTSPAAGSWTSPNGDSYTVSYTKNPFNCIKFDTETGINSGQSDTLTYTIPTCDFNASQLEEIEIHVGNSSAFDIYLLPQVGQTSTHSNPNVTATISAVSTDNVAGTTTIGLRITNNDRHGLSYVAFSLVGSPSTQYGKFTITVQNTGDVIQQNDTVTDPVLNPAPPYQIWTSQVLPGQGLQFVRYFSGGYVENTATVTGVNVLSGYPQSIANSTASVYDPPPDDAQNALVMAGTPPAPRPSAASAGLAILSGGSLPGPIRTSILLDLLAAEVATPPSTTQTRPFSGPGSPGMVALIAGPVVTTPHGRLAPVGSQAKLQPNTASYGLPSGFSVPNVATPVVPLSVVIVPNLAAIDVPIGSGWVDASVRPTWM
jgi:hypothetical protein